MEYYIGDKGILKNIYGNADWYNGQYITIFEIGEIYIKIKNNNIGSILIDGINKYIDFYEQEPFEQFEDWVED